MARELESVRAAVSRRRGSDTFDLTSDRALFRQVIRREVRGGVWHDPDPPLTRRLETQNGTGISRRERVIGVLTRNGMIPSADALITV